MHFMKWNILLLQPPPCSKLFQSKYLLKGFDLGQIVMCLWLRCGRYLLWKIYPYWTVENRIGEFAIRSKFSAFRKAGHCNPVQEMLSSFPPQKYTIFLPPKSATEMFEMKEVVIHCKFTNCCCFNVMMRKICTLMFQLPISLVASGDSYIRHYLLRFPESSIMVEPCSQVIVFYSIKRTGDKWVNLFQSSKLVFRRVPSLPFLNFLAQSDTSPANLHALNIAGNPQCAWIQTIFIHAVSELSKLHIFAE